MYSNRPLRAVKASSHLFLVSQIALIVAKESYPTIKLSFATGDHSNMAASDILREASLNLTPY